MASRTLAIGDIHGCLTQLDALLQKIAPTPEDELILLGDCVDRGPGSAGVMNRLLSLSKTHQLSAIRGNHEQLMLNARLSSDRLRDWIANGGDATLRSYAGVRSTLRDVAADHRDFLEAHLVDYLETETHPIPFGTGFALTSWCGAMSQVRRDVALARS